MDNFPSASTTNCKVSLHTRRSLHSLFKRLWPIALILIAGILVGGWFLYQRSSRSVILIVDGTVIPLRTHRHSIQMLLQDLRLPLEPIDIIMPPPEAPILGGETIIVKRAFPYLIEIDGQVHYILSHARDVRTLLLELGVEARPHDRLFIRGEPTSLSTHLDTFFPPSTEQIVIAGIPVPARPFPVRATLRRAKAFHLYDGHMRGELFSTASTIGEALFEHGIVLYSGDRVTPSLGTVLSDGMNVFIRRSVPVEIAVDGRRLRARTLSSTVGEILSQIGIALVGKDRVSPSEETPISENLAIEVTRVREEIIEEQESIPYETVWQADGELEIDQQRLLQAGEEGITKRRVRVLYENESEVGRFIEDEWLDREPQTKIINYGTKIVIRKLDTPEGQIEYWRRIRVLATSYSASTAGKNYDHPEFGITFLGWPMRHGIVAVDPTVINLRSNIYIPGYGKGVAGDTGGAIKGRRVDLGYDDDKLILWYKWVDVYLLTPVPPRDKIRWVLPNWPRERP